MTPRPQLLSRTQLSLLRVTLRLETAFFYHIDQVAPPLILRPNPPILSREDALTLTL